MEFRLKQLRKERHISQIKLAIDLNMNQNSISRYENLEREADYATLILIADYFDVSLDYLLGRTEKKKAPTNRCLVFIPRSVQASKGTFCSAKVNQSLLGLPDSAVERHFRGPHIGAR